MSNSKNAISARRCAFNIIRQITAADSYANLALAAVLKKAQLDSRDAGLVTELVSGTCRYLGTYDLIIETAAGRKLSTLQPAVIDLLRIGCHQILNMGLPAPIAVNTIVDLASKTVGRRVVGIVNAILRKVAAHDYRYWITSLTSSLSPEEALAISQAHPYWVVKALSDALSNDQAELVLSLEANNKPPVPTLVIRPGLCEIDELLQYDTKKTKYSSFGVSFAGNPGGIDAVKQGRAGVQDEGSQLVVEMFLNTPVDPKIASLPWLDLCAGPGGKSALLAGLITSAKFGNNSWLCSNELQFHRANLVAQTLKKYPSNRYQVNCADGMIPPWQQNSFSRVLVDVPCSGLGALRRRPESRWRRQEADIDQLHPIQLKLLTTALESCAPGGIVAYVTCSPHIHETKDVVEEVLANTKHIIRKPPIISTELSNYLIDDYVQLWPHRHGTDAMFLALIEKG